MNFWQPNKNKAGKQSESDQQHSKPKPWTVAQIIAMLWPQDLQVDIETIDKDSVLELRRGTESDKPSKIQVADLLRYVNEYMIRLNLPTNIDDMDFKDMSGGQMRKLRLAIYFAIAECIKPRLFMIDEPFNDLDKHSELAICKMLKEFKEKNAGTTTFVVTHQDNDSLRLNLYDRVILMRNSNKPIDYYGPVGAEGTLASSATGYYKHIEENKIGRRVVPQHTCFDLP
jgi:ABC-type Mn2+/Zn2+ transport system ATPase subunit